MDNYTYSIQIQKAFQLSIPCTHLSHMGHQVPHVPSGPYRKLFSNTSLLGATSAKIWA